MMRGKWLAALGVPFALGLASAGYQTAGMTRDRRRFPPPGELIDVGGRRLHMWREGSGTPPVVLIPALGGPAAEWADVQHELAVVTTVCVYDRAGLGWSDGGPLVPATPGRMADDLHRLVDAARIPRPFVLAGHSVGGLAARMYAARHPGDLAALVLIDSSHEDQFWRLRENDPWEGAHELWLRAARSRLTPLGLVRLADRLGVADGRRRGVAYSYPSGFTEAGLAFSLSSKQRRADICELLGFALGMAEVRRTAGSLRALPLLVIAGGPKGRERWYRGWAELQREFAGLSSRSTQRVADHSGHHLHRDAPDVVIRGIENLVEKLRAEAQHR